MGKVAKYLNQLTIGNVFDTPDVLEAYSSDCSALKIRPKIVALPESTEDVRKIMSFCYQLALKKIRIPVAVRGSGLDETGADLTSGLVLSTEKLNRLLESDKRERLVRVQAGITLKELNTALSVHALTIPIGGHENETIGGLISNCPSDGYSGKYGGIMNYVERLEVVLPNGEILQTNRLGGHSVAKKAKEKTLEGLIYRKMAELLTVNNDLVKEIHRSNNGSAGYPTVAQVKRGNSLNLAPLFFGAQGTLGVITEVILRAVPIRSDVKRVVATFENFDVAQKFLDLANSLKPKELNIYDIRIIKTAEQSGKRLSEITRKINSGYVVFGKFDERTGSALRKINGIGKVLPKSSQLIIESSQTKAKIDEFENSLIVFLNNTRSGERVPLLTDFYLPADNLYEFVNNLRYLERNLRLDLAIYGSYSASNYNLRPKFKVADLNFSRNAITFLEAGAYMINREGGSITGGIPEGRVKALVSNQIMTDNERALYLTIKKLFDHQSIMNPDIKLNANKHFTVTHFRTSSSSKIVV